MAWNFYPHPTPTATTHTHTHKHTRNFYMLGEINIDVANRTLSEANYKVFMKFSRMGVATGLHNTCGMGVHIQ